MRTLLLLATCLAASACSPIVVPGVTFGGPALISGHSPPNAISANSDPESVGSLPPGAEGIGPRGPNSRFPNYGSITVPSPL